MDLVCPNCKTSVAIDPAKVREGEPVPCPSCKHLFAPAPQAVAAGSTGPSARRGAPRGSDAAIPTSRSRGRGHRLPLKIGPYEILDEISRGGMGIVYKARDPILRRLVAIKVLLAGEGATDEDVKRFQREALASAQLKHANIVTIHSIGEYEGKPYFVLDFIEGRTVKQLLEDGPISPRLALRITEQCAEAVDHATRQGVIHRDVKPANIMVDAEGHAKIMDFGLARRLDEDLHITQSGTTMGTPSYMSPEQAEGKLSAVDGQSDIYSLGAVLYEMLTGQPPFDGPTTMAVLRKVLDDDPIAPRKLNPRIHTDIQTICLKCLEKEKPRRYLTGRALAEDIRRFNAGEPISAAPLGVGPALWRKARKHRSVTLTLFTAAAVGIAALVYILYAQASDRDERLRQHRALVAGHIKSGEAKLEKAQAAAEALAQSDGRVFEEQMAEVRKLLREAEDAFRRAEALDADDPKVRDGLAGIDRQEAGLEVEEFVYLARNFMKPQPGKPQPNYDAAKAFADLALKKDPEHEEAIRIRKKAGGIRSVSVFSDGGTAEVYARMIADAQGHPIPSALHERAGAGESLGWTPIRQREMSPGLYVLTFQRQGFEPQEATLLVSRESEPTVSIDPVSPERNMVRIPAGLAAVPFTEDVPVAEFLIDRFEYPNRAGQVPKTGVETVLEARALCRKENKQLCTSAQWLRACMGDERFKWPYGESYVAGICATGFDPDAQKRPVGSGTFPLCRNKAGIYDMSGNVGEWTDGDEKGEIVYGGNWADYIQTPDTFISCRARQAAFLVNKERTGVRCCKSNAAVSP